MSLTGRPGVPKATCVAFSLDGLPVLRIAGRSRADVSIQGARVTLGATVLSTPSALGKAGRMERRWLSKTVAARGDLSAPTSCRSLRTPRFLGHRVAVAPGHSPRTHCVTPGNPSWRRPPRVTRRETRTRTACGCDLASDGPVGGRGNEPSARADRHPSQVAAAGGGARYLLHLPSPCRSPRGVFRGQDSRDERAARGRRQGPG